MKPRKPFATTDEDDRISELTEAIIEALRSESKSGKDRPFMFTALMSVFSHLAATLTDTNVEISSGNCARKYPTTKRMQSALLT